jgi:hypothetical protein
LRDGSVGIAFGDPEDFEHLGRPSLHEPIRCGDSVEANDGLRIPDAHTEEAGGMMLRSARALHDPDPGRRIRRFQEPGELAGPPRGCIDPLEEGEYDRDGEKRRYDHRYPSPS